MRIETNAELFASAATIFLSLLLHVLIFKDVIKNFLEKPKRLIENDVAELGASEDTILHLFKLDVLEAEHFLRVVIGDGCALHPSNLHLHDVLQEATANQIIELTLEA